MKLDEIQHFQSEFLRSSSHSQTPGCVVLGCASIQLFDKNFQGLEILYSPKDPKHFIEAGETISFFTFFFF